MVEFSLKFELMKKRRLWCSRQQSGERKFSVRFGRQGGDASAVAGKVQDRQAERQHGREVALR